VTRFESSRTNFASPPRIMAPTRFGSTLILSVRDYHSPTNLTSTTRCKRRSMRRTPPGPPPPLKCGSPVLAARHDLCVVCGYTGSIVAGTPGAVHNACNVSMTARISVAITCRAISQITIPKALATQYPRASFGTRPVPGFALVLRGQPQASHSPALAPVRHPSDSGGSPEEC
jgi:hypothetical protein